MQFVKESIIRAAPERVFAFHELPDAFERLMPPWENLKIIQKADLSRIGSRAIIEQKIFGVVRIRWVAEHTKYDPPRLFEDDIAVDHKIPIAIGGLDVLHNLQAATVEANSQKGARQNGGGLANDGQTGDVKAT